MVSALHAVSHPTAKIINVFLPPALAYLVCTCQKHIGSCLTTVYMTSSLIYFTYFGIYGHLCPRCPMCNSVTMKTLILSKPATKKFTAQRLYSTGTLSTWLLVKYLIWPFRAILFEQETLEYKVSHPNMCNTVTR